MPPGSIERYNVSQSESNVSGQRYIDNEKRYIDIEKRYIDIERGDVVPFSIHQSQHNNQTPSQSSDRVTGVSQNKINVIDPLEIVRSMISAGFMPTRAQLANALNHSDGPIDSSNTWFAIFLQKLLRDVNKINKIKN